MSYLDPHHDLTPPPAYSEEDFDRKTSIALELSRQSHDSGDELRAIWHDDAFEAAAQALAASKPYVPSQFVSAGPAFQHVNPLKINKKSESTSKPLPNWYTTHQLPTHADELPAFTSRGPSLDGPPYEQVAWAGGRSNMNMPSALAPRTLPTPQVQQSRGDVYHRKPRHSLPQIPRTQHPAMPQRPISQHPSHRPMQTPISTFDPSMAYHQDSNLGLPQQSVRDYEMRDDIHGASSLYNAVVANHLKSPPRQAPNNRVASSYRNQSARESSLCHLSPTRGQEFIAGRQMAPAQNPASPRFSQYPPYLHTPTTPGSNSERQMASYYHYGDG